MTHGNTITVPADPLFRMGLRGYARAYRAGGISSEQVTRAYLDRIAAFDSRLGSFQHVAADRALATARALDSLRAAGVWLGPLMGVPIAIKDIFVIGDMPPPSVGSRMVLPPAAGDAEGPFIRALRQAGCVFLGQTKAVELCLGITGVSAPLGTPLNPYDLERRHVPGGSSSGSAVAAAAGLCALAIGSDSGGSVRVPAAYNGLFGYKTSRGLWPTEGAFPLDPRVDTIGVLARTADDAMVAHEAIAAGLFGLAEPAIFPAVEIDRLRIGVPDDYFLDGLSADLRRAFDATLAALTAAGVRLDAVAVPEASEREAYFPVAMPAALIATLGPAEFARQKNVMDPVVRARVETGLDSPAHVFLAAEDRRQRSIAAVRRRFDGFDAWLAPTTVSAAPALSEFEDPDRALALALGMTRNTQPANYLDMCAVTLPMPQPVGRLPLGVQFMAPAGHEASVLSLAREVEGLLGRQAPPVL